MTFVSDFEPQVLWRHFDHILTIPRGSKKEDLARAYVIQIAEKNGLEYVLDAVGNVVVRKPAIAGREKAPATILQAHLDMVQEKNSDVDHDFEVDPIQPVRDGEYLTASGTTLGSDNGIGVAAMLAIMESRDLVHGPLELLFTIDEETGMTGASGLGEDMLTGRKLINLDSEEEGVVTIGCAGGADSHLHLSLTTESVPGAGTALDINLAGLKGGHSGVDIHLQRGNAIKLLARALYAVSLDRPVRLICLEGGNAHNAIPREASAAVFVPGADEVSDVSSAIESEFEAIRGEFRHADPGMTWEIVASPSPEATWSARCTADVLGLLTALPHGVMSISHDMPGLVETSTNLAVVGETDGRLSILLSNRSSVMSALAALRHRVRAIASLAGADVEEHGGYPAWQPIVDSEMLEVVRGVHRRIAGEPEVGAVHAGLECSIVAEKYPGIDMVSFGPQIDFPHSPDEKVKIPSVAAFYRVLLGTLEALA
jgi:dipeptidase D